MKAKRIINLVVWLVVAVALVVVVCLEWHRQGCGWWSFVAASVVYGLMCIAGCVGVDDMLREGGKR